MDGAIAAGYAHTPVGALVATANIMYRYGLAPDSQWRAVAQSMLAPGSGRNAWIRARSAAPQGESPAPAGTYTQIVAFQFVSYSPSDAVTQVVTRDASGTLQVSNEHVSWVIDDWRLVLAANGGASNTQQIDSLVGFIAWGGA